FTLSMTSGSCMGLLYTIETSQRHGSGSKHAHSAALCDKQPARRRFAARLSGLAFGLALAVRPAGLAEAPGSTARRRRVPRSGMRSTVEAGEEKSPERPVLPLSQVFLLADAFADRRYRLLVLLAVFSSLR